MPPRKRPPAKTNGAEPLQNSSGMHLQLFLRYLEAECGMSTNTVQAYCSDLQQFFEWFGTQRTASLNQIDLKQMSNYLNHLHGRKLAATTIARHLVSIKMFFRYLVLEGVLFESAVELVSSPKLWQHLPKVLSPEMVNRLLAAPGPEDRYQLRDRALLALMYSTGCRTSEVINLKQQDFHADHDFCRCVGKGNKERIVSLNPVSRSAVENYLEHERSAMVYVDDEGWLFVTKRGNQLSRIMVWNIVKKYAARIGCSREVSPHTLRHSFATHMLAGGAEIRALQEMLGHASVRTTQIYTHVEHSRLKAVHQQAHPRG